MRPTLQAADFRDDFAPDALEYTGNQKILVGPLREQAMARLRAEGAEIEGVRYGG